MHNTSQSPMYDVLNNFINRLKCCTADVCHWALCSTTSAVAVFSLRPDGSTCASAQQPAAIYLPAPGAAVCSTRLLLIGDAKLAVLCSQSPATRGSCHSRAADAGEVARLKVSVLDASSALAAGKQQQRLQPVCSDTLPPASAAEDAVTQQLLAGGDGGTPHLLIQVGHVYVDADLFQIVALQQAGTHGQCFAPILHCRVGSLAPSLWRPLPVSRLAMTSGCSCRAQTAGQSPASCSTSGSRQSSKPCRMMCCCQVCLAI
jgi:hypothetical protein